MPAVEEKKSRLVILNNVHNEEFEAMVSVCCMRHILFASKYHLPSVQLSSNLLLLPLFKKEA